VRPRIALTALVIVLWHLCASRVAAQTAIDLEGAKTLEISRATAEVVVDGVLDEATWSQATLVEDLHQVDPFEYAEPSQRTEIRIFYDDDALYIGARMWDTEAERITANVLRQGEGLGSDDRFGSSSIRTSTGATATAFRSTRTACVGKRFT